MAAEEHASRTSSEAIIWVLNALTAVSIEAFDDRMKLQKLAYLAREMGLDCGLAFDWYVRGPYSPSLTRILFAADELGMLRIENPPLNDSEKNVVKSIKELLGTDIDDPRGLELIASVWYFLPKGTLSRKERNAIVRKLVECKPQFSGEEISRTINRILRFRRKKQHTS